MEFQAEEILKAIKSISPLKASGNNGFPAIFFQKYWNIVGEETTVYYLQILNGQRNMEEVNRTSIVLIPKGFMERLMRRMGFCDEWISLIMRCITSATYTMVTNGKNGKEFRPTRGLRQGDPLSPYLFLTCAEGFSRLIEKAKREGRLLGAKVGRSNISVTHLFFADDSILFGKASTKGANTLKRVINDYEALSGQKVNFEKSLIYFSGNVDEELQEQVGNTLGVRISNNPEKYLGLPTTGWKIIMQPNCLFARVMKAKYFPIIYLAKHMGSQTYSKVSNLIERNFVTWKQKEIRSLFGEEQMQRIVSIPLVSSEPQDVLIWRGDNKGTYTAKNSYRRLNTTEDPRIQHNPLTKLYTKLWNLKVPSKIRIHLCKVVNEFVLVLYNLKLQKLVINTTCLVRQEEEETASHLFRDCNFTRQVLRDLGDINATCNRETNWKTWLATEFEHLTEEECKIRTIFLWIIWYNRNRVYHEGRRILVHEVVGFINAYCAEIKHMGEVIKIRTKNNSKEWRPPRGDVIKINFDASFNQIQHISVARIIVRNKEGLVMASCTYPGENIVDPTTTEARTCLLAVTMAEEIGFHEIQVEGDALTVIRKLNLETEDRSCIRVYIQEIKRKSLGFRSIKFKHVPRAANKVVHGLAMEVWKYKDLQYWVEEAPRAVEELMNNDRNRNDGRRNDSDESGS
ncbi:reverse transcriptase [Gossypium australe]|uniref:Reverse transcriptase n=1 Tax=Gossypium australe TaxID=47621 RepID=A0A5B6V7Q1_9ROSI|nr:reverse transcriptase [Gossypium australe]